MPKDREFELKFAVSPEAMERLVSHPVLGGSSSQRRPSRLVSTYFDTDEQLLRRQHVSLRIRKAEGVTTHTLKRAKGSMIDRDEWEREDNGSQPDLAWLRSTPLKSLFENEAVADGLEARFTVDVTRTVLPILFETTMVEGALDEGTIRSGGLSLPVHEFELECKNGPSAGVIRLARRLARDLPLTLSLASKAERGFGVADLSWGRPSKVILVDRSEARTLRQLVMALVQGCLHALCRNAALVGERDDAEAVHATRIALRHLRAVLKLFGPVLRRKRSARLRSELKWMSDKLGAARDADVIRDVATGADTMAALGAALEPRHRRAHSRLEAALSSARWRLLLLDLLAFSMDGVRRRRRGDRAAPFVRARLRSTLDDVATRGRNLRHGSPESRHEVRKRAKMLRYDLELLAGMPKLGLRRKHLRRVGDDLHTLQQTLGELQDASAWRQQVQSAVLDRRAPLHGMTEEAWAAARKAARTVVADPVRSAKPMRKAAKAFERLAGASL